jgi:hypothetical protein
MCDGGGGYGSDGGGGISSDLGGKTSDYSSNTIGSVNSDGSINAASQADNNAENNDTGFNGFGDSAPAVVMAAMNGIFNPSPGIDTPASASKPAASTTPSKSAEAYEKEKDSLRRNRRTTILASAGSGLGGKSTLLGQ